MVIPATQWLKLKLIGQLHPIGREISFLAVRCDRCPDYLTGLSRRVRSQKERRRAGRSGVSIDWREARALEVDRYCLITWNEYAPAETCRPCRVRPFESEPIIAGSEEARITTHCEGPSERRSRRSRGR